MRTPNYTLELTSRQRLELEGALSSAANSLVNEIKEDEAYGQLDGLLEPEWSEDPAKLAKLAEALRENQGLEEEFDNLIEYLLALGEVRVLERLVNAVKGHCGCCGTETEDLISDGRGELPAVCETCFEAEG